MQAVDGLGYGLMSLATLFATFAFAGKPMGRLVRWSFVFNGALALPILLTYAPLLVPRPYYSAALAAAALWAASVPVSTIVAALYFSRTASALEVTRESR